MIEGIKNYINRCVQYLDRAGAPERLIKALQKVPLHPAESIYEAVVAWNFVLYLDNCDNLVVRVGGYSEYFHVLPDELKKMIIERTIQKTV